MKNISKASFRTSVLALAIAAALPLGAQAAGLGQIRVLSGLGQPLQAEIAVQAEAGELDSLRARLASPEDFARARLSYSAAAAAVQVSIGERGGKPVLRLSSAAAVNDPFVELLVELDSLNGRVLREYTLLLDPVDFDTVAPTPAPLQAPSTAATTTTTTATPPPAATRTAARALAPLATPPPATEYRVRSGDTLTRIAQAQRQPGVSLEQMLVALHRANPQAFDGGNMNRLRAGAVLNLPAAADAMALDDGQAQREIRAQAADFNRYRRQLADVAPRPATRPEAATQAGAGAIKARVEEARPLARDGDELKVSQSAAVAAAAAGGDAHTAARLEALEEELEARDRALEEANARLAQLESSIRDMQKLLELRSAALAQLQQDAVPASELAEASPSEQEVPEEPAADEVVAASEPSEAEARALAGEPPLEEAADGDEISLLFEEAIDAEPAESSPSLPAAAPAAATEAARADDAAGEAVREEAATAAAAAEPKEKPRRRARPPAPEPVAPAQPGFVDSLLEDPMLLAGGGGILALLLAYVGIKRRQRNQQEEDRLDDPVPVHELPPTAEGVFASTGGQSVDTSQSSILHTDFGQTGLAAIDADEGVDPVAEADVYMAYGRDAQAEEILQDALKTDPERHAIYLKLLEIYAQRRDQGKFELLATELYARTTGEGADWAKAAAMGRKLDPENLLYVEEQGGAVAAAAEATPAAEDFSAPAMTGVPEASAALPQDEEAEPEQAASLAELDFTASQPFALEEALEPSKSQLRDTWTVPGELRQYDETDGEAPGLGDAEQILAALEQMDMPAPEAAAEAALDLESSGIDFELDLGDLAAPEPVAPAPEVAEPAVADDFSLDFDLPELDDEGVAPAVAAAEQEGDGDSFELDELPAALEAGAGGGSLMDNVSFELPDLDLAPLSESAPEQSAAAEEPLPGELPELPTGAAGSEEAESSVVDLEKTSFDASMLDFDFDIEPPQAADEAQSALDVTTLDLDLAGFDVAEGGADATPVSLEATQLGQLPADFDALDPGTLMGQGADSEVDTKLELARAYEDMGDHEGARELLEEVLAEGSEAQQQAAREVMARLL